MPAAASHRCTCSLIGITLRALRVSRSAAAAPTAARSAGDSSSVEQQVGGELLVLFAREVRLQRVVLREAEALQPSDRRRLLLRELDLHDAAAGRAAGRARRCGRVGRGGRRGELGKVGRLEQLLEGRLVLVDLQVTRGRR